MDMTTLAHQDLIDQMTLEESGQAKLVLELEKTYPNALMKGPAADNANQINVTMGQIASIMFYLVPLCLIILILATRHWIEPLLFLLAIGVGQVLIVEFGGEVFRTVPLTGREWASVIGFTSLLAVGGEAVRAIRRKRQ